MVIAHFITISYPPVRGGLETWTQQLATWFAQSGVHVIVYIASNKPVFQSVGPSAGVELVWLPGLTRVLEEPLRASAESAHRLRAEIGRFHGLVLRNRVAAALARWPDARHVVLSNYLTNVGFSAALICEELNLPHIACVVGTDFSRGFRNPHERQIIGTVVQQADCVVTKSAEQEAALRKAFAIPRLATIRTGVSEAVFEYKWSPQQSDNIELISDTGYSHKKGTQILLAAVAKLLAEGIPARLTLFGEVELDQKEYWSRLRAEYRVSFPAHMQLDDHVERQRVWKHIAVSHIYCSATLGEGCSHARAAALCIGIPVVTTRCGEMAGLRAAHVRLASPGDDEGFHLALRTSCVDYLNQQLTQDSAAVAQWREQFQLQRELDTWLHLLNDVAGRIPRTT